MSLTRNQRVSVAAAIVLLATVGILWQIGDVRTMQATEEKQAELEAQVVTAREIPDDYDGDGIADAADRCPTRPETDNGFQDDDGCPDVVETTGAS
jgi:hypothetical protein